MYVAVIQMEPHIGETQANVERCMPSWPGGAPRCRSHRSARALQHRLCFQSRAEAPRLPSQFPTARQSERGSRLSRLNIHLVAGITEREAISSSIRPWCIGPGGLIGRYRKNHLWADEALYFYARRSGLSGFRHARSAGSAAISAMIAGFPKASVLRHCKVRKFSACRPIGYPYPDRIRGARPWRISSSWEPPIAIRSLSRQPIASELNADSHSSAKA